MTVKQISVFLENKPGRLADFTDILSANNIDMRAMSLAEAADFVRTVECRQGVKISAPEEIAFINGFIGKEKLLESAQMYGKSPYGEHLKAVAEGKVRY